MAYNPPVVGVTQAERPGRWHHTESEWAPPAMDRHWGIVVFGMRLIRRPWKGCRFWDVPFTIPWKGCKFQKWGFPKWGYRIWNFRFFNVLHKEEAYVAYVVVLSSGGWGDVNVRVERFHHVTEEAHVGYVVVWSSGGVGGVGGGC